MPFLELGQPACEEGISAALNEKGSSRLCRKLRVLKQDDFRASFGRAAVLGIDGHHTALARTQVNHAIRELDREITAPDDDGLRRVAMAAPLPFTAAGDPHQADGDAAALGGFLGAAGGREACECGGEINHCHDVSL